MLEDLRIKDFALIDSAEVEFNDGFTVLSGETGAGKSLLIGALTFLLGGKGGVEQIRSGCAMATVSGTFFIDGNLQETENSDNIDEPKNALQWLSLHGIELEDNRILIRRAVKQNGKSAAWIGNTPVTRSELAEFSSFLIDIHGQHEHQSLMKVSEHRKFLDSYAELNPKVEEFTALYTKLVSERKKLSSLLENNKNREEKIEVLSFAVKEIEEAKLKPNEDTELEEEESKLLSFEKLYSEVENITSIMETSGQGILSSLKKIRSSSEQASSLDSKLQPLDSRLESVFYELSDISNEYSNYLHSLVFDPERLAFVQDRQSLIYSLKKKYASSVNSPVSEVIKFEEDAKKRLEELTGGEKNLDFLRQEILSLEKSVFSLAKEISAKRKTAAEKMSLEVKKLLQTLGMKDTLFSVNVSDKQGTDLEQKCGPYGIDDVEFLIAANPGTPLQSLAKIASGGELSRVMLALKTVLAQSDSIETLIFDEIDTGIGGEVAVSVGLHLQKLSQKKQVLCITHLASIAVYADNQLKILKSVENGLTHTQVLSVQGENRVLEIARMLSGDAASSESLEHSRAMLLKFSKNGGY